MSGTLIELPLGLPGLTDHTSFELRARAEGSAYSWLRSVDDPSIEVLVIDALRLRPEYPLALLRRSLGFLHLEDDEPLRALAPCTVPAAPEEAFANLLTPIGLGARSLRGAQIVLHDATLDARVPLPG